MDMNQFCGLLGAGAASLRLFPAPLSAPQYAHHQPISVGKAFGLVGGAFSFVGTQMRSAVDAQNRP
jgi:hypothetical protein